MNDEPIAHVTQDGGALELAGGVKGVHGAGDVGAIVVKRRNEGAHIMSHQVHRAIGEISEQLVRPQEMHRGHWIGRSKGIQRLSRGMEGADHLAAKGMAVEPGQRDVALRDAGRRPPAQVAGAGEIGEPLIVLVHPQPADLADIVHGFGGDSSTLSTFRKSVVIRSRSNAGSHFQSRRAAASSIRPGQLASSADTAGSGSNRSIALGSR